MNPDVCYRPLGMVEIRPASTSELPVIRDLARIIWPAAYRDILSPAQLDYMLAYRYELPRMHADVAQGLEYELLRVDGEPLGFAAHSPTPDPSERKLNQLYVHPEWHGRGLGGRLLEYVEKLSRARGVRRLVLTVNRHNRKAQAVYFHRGFVVREEACVDIGQGFVMDDFVLVKEIAA